ncbi:hypothetical protein [Alkalicoccobacillus murimartini]|uniref:PqqD family protein n=1 Tax=Alkalicoccobacillus murimartini TaxID=171685 RepID=A0ABT9YFK6_9BACI|nr:hypothetical protein [Alkalicoccobacillus murimartini]MDQ0206631.1 hypothetical protein [Alkalicoccobacillus murimartini]
MNNNFIILNKNCKVSPMAEGNSAFVFNKSPFKVSIIGPISLSIYKLIESSECNGVSTRVIDVVNKLTKIIELNSKEKESEFENSILVSIGQLFQLGLIELTNGGE